MRAKAFIVAFDDGRTAMVGICRDSGFDDLDAFDDHGFDRYVPEPPFDRGRYETDLVDRIHAAGHPSEHRITPGPRIALPRVIEVQVVLHIDEELRKLRQEVKDLRSEKKSAPQPKPGPKAKVKKNVVKTKPPGGQSKRQERRDRMRPAKFQGSGFTATKEVDGVEKAICWNYNLGTCAGKTCSRGNFLHVLQGRLWRRASIHEVPV